MSTPRDASLSPAGMSRVRCRAQLPTATCVARVPSRRPPSPGWRPTCGCSARWASATSPPFPPRSSPTRPGSTPRSCARTCPSSVRTASAASATTSSTLTEQIARALGLTVHRSVALIGVGNLGQALAGYAGFASRGFRIAALVDADPRAGRHHRPRPGRPRHRRPGRIVAEQQITIAVLAIPAEVAQEVCDRLVAAGVTSILNFAPTVLSVPDARRRAQGRPGRRAADPVLPREPQERRTADDGRRRSGAGPGWSAMTVLVVGCRTAPRRCRVLEARAVADDELRKIARRAAPWRGDQRGAAALHLQPHRGLRRRRPFPPRRRRDQHRARPARRADCGRLSEHLYVHFAEAAAEHMFSVASGLDSMVVGESQILGQLRAAYALGADTGTVGTRAARPRPDRAAGRQAGARRDRHRPGRRVGRVGRAGPGRRRARRRSPGRRAVIVGAGSMGALAGATLRRRGVRRARRRQPLARAGRAAGRHARRPGGRLDDVAALARRSPTPTCWSPPPAPPAWSSSRT